jgi:hypothetical protein
MGVFEMGSQELLSRLASNHDPSDLCLLSSWNPKHEPPAPGCLGIFTNEHFSKMFILNGDLKFQ